MKKRNRSPILKEQKFKEIIKIGKQELLVEDVFEAEHSSSSLQARKMSFSGFNMQDIAQKVNMTRSNLYRYVESKRELWFAILQEFVEEYNKEVDEIITNHKGSYLELIEKLITNYISFGSQDSHLMQKMIFMNPPQPKYQDGTPEMGPIERNYRKLDDVIPKIQEVMENAIKAGELISMNAQFFMQYFWGTIQGSILILEDMERYPNGTDDYKKEFEHFVIEQIHFKLKTYTPEYHSIYFS